MDVGQEADQIWGRVGINFVLVIEKLCLTGMH